MAASEPPREDVFLPGGQVCRECLSDAAFAVLGEAIGLARQTRWDTVRSPHVFMGLLAAPDPAIRAWGERISDDLQHLLDQFRELFHLEEGHHDALLVLNREFLSNNVIRLLRDAYARALDHGRRAITPMDLLICLLTSTDSIVAECFERIGVTAAKLTELAVLVERQA